MIKLLQLFCQEGHEVATYSNRILSYFYLNKLPPDELLGETAVVVSLFYFILTCSTNNTVIEIQNLKKQV